MSRYEIHVNREAGFFRTLTSSDEGETLVSSNVLHKDREAAVSAAREDILKGIRDAFTPPGVSLLAGVAGTAVLLLIISLPLLMFGVGAGSVLFWGPMVLAPLPAASGICVAIEDGRRIAEMRAEAEGALIF